MADVHSKEIRSKNMRAIRSKNTKPEVYIRSLLHRHGFRFRIHPKNLPSKPDIYLPKYKAVIWVNGCFWHGHDCHLFKWPKSNVEKWEEKIQANLARDRVKRDELHNLGLRILTIWECSLKGKYKLSENQLMVSLDYWLKHSSTDLDITFSQN